MRLTQKVCSGLRDISVRRWNKVWTCRGRFYDYPAAVPEVLKEKGIEVVEMNQVKPEFPRWTPPVPDDPRFTEPLPPEERADWKDEPAFTFDKRMRLFEGIKQACLLAKAKHFEGVPPSVERLIGKVDVPDRDLLLQRYIMQSQVWNTSEEKLPKRYDSRKPHWHFQREFGIKPAHSSQILLRNLLRLCQSQVTQLPSLSSRRQIADPLLHSYVMYKGQPLVLKQTVSFMVTSDKGLAPFGDESIIDASVGQTIPDMWPVYPTVDFLPSNNYELNNLTGFSNDLPSLHPHTLVDVVTQDHWEDTHIQGNQVLACLMTAAAIARKRFGDDVSILPEPISIQHIALRETRLVCTYFQLNTLDLDNNNTGVKNLVWTQGQGSNLCEKLLGQPWMPRPMKKMRLLSFDGSGFDSFLATYLNGCQELSSSSSKSTSSSSLSSQSSSSSSS